MQEAGRSVLLEPDQFQKNSNFLIIDNREGSIINYLKLLMLPINVILISNLVASSFVLKKTIKNSTA